MSETFTQIQQAVQYLNIDSEAVVRALETLAGNRLAYHTIPALSARMQMPPSEVERMLKPLENTVLERIDRHGEKTYTYAPATEEIRRSVDTALGSYGKEKEQLRAALSQQAEITRLAEELELNRDLMNTILTNVGEILIVDMEGSVMACSAFVEQQLTVRKGDALAILREKLSFDPLDETIEKTDIQMDGRYLECQLSNFISRGKRIGRNISIKDVTEERRLQEAREMYERSRRQLFSIIAHELQNPALGLQSFLQDTLDIIDRLLVCGKVPEFEPDLVALKEDVYLNQRGQTLLNRVISDIFDYVKLQRGQMHFDVESDVSVDYLIALAAMQCRPLCERKDIRLITPPDEAFESIPDLRGDSTRLVQVLNNLIKNAVKFTPPHGEIRVEVSESLEGSGVGEEAKAFAVIAIADSGRGMAREEIELIFKEYRGAESDGMGLGLMIADLIVKAHGGRIDIESQPGYGSTFRIFLPVSTQSTPASSVYQYRGV